MNVERGRHNLTLYSRCYEMDTSMMMSYIHCVLFTLVVFHFLLSENLCCFAWVVFLFS